MTAMTRSASMTPSSMSFASSEASLTLCSGTLRTSIGAGTDSLFLRRDGTGTALLQGPAASLRAVGGKRVLLHDGADVVAFDGVGDVLERGDDGALPALLHEPEGGLDLGAHRAPGELAVGGVRAHLGDGHAAERSRRGRAEV